MLCLVYLYAVKLLELIILYPSTCDHDTLKLL